MNDNKDAAVKLIEAAVAAREKAYAPYSGFRVGSALITDEGRIYTGCNVENASYGLTCCAERVAVFKAVSSGENSFRAIAITADTDGYCPPCGACLQVMREFSPRMEVYMCNSRKEYRVKTVAELLPEGFDLERNKQRGEKI